jgi:hypothetical protein
MEYPSRIFFTALFWRCNAPCEDESRWIDTIYTFHRTTSFCFHTLHNDATAMQRKRALVTAEESLQNQSGCARAEGMNAFHKSGGSGRITRALVRRADEETTKPEFLSVPGAVGLSLLPKVTAPFEEKLVARLSHIHFRGLFAKVGFPKHSMIIEHTYRVHG